MMLNETPTFDLLIRTTSFVWRFSQHLVNYYLFTIFIGQGKCTPQILHAIINRCNDADVVASVSNGVFLFN